MLGFNAFSNISLKAFVRNADKQISYSIVRLGHIQKGAHCEMHSSGINGYDPITVGKVNLMAANNALLMETIGWG